MYKIKNLLQNGKNFLKNKNIESYSIDSEILLAFILNKDRNQILLDYDVEIDGINYQNFLKLLNRRANSEPISQIIGYKDFWKSKFLVNKSTLIPRPETELLIEEILKIYQEKKNLLFADFGSGTGCIGLSLLQELSNSKCFLVEKSKNAMKMIKNNAKNLNLSDRSIFKNISWNDLKIRKKLDFIVSNPPYIAKSEKNFLMKDVVNFESSRALFANDNGLKAYHEIMNLSKNFLKKDGYLFFEIDQNYKNIRIPNFMELIDVKKDLLGLERVMILRRL